MYKSALRLTLLSLVAGTAANALAQGMPTTQPKLLAIYREELKTGRAGDHARWEAGWPAAYEKAGSKFHYLALSSITGASEVWYLTPLADHAAYGEMMKMDADPALGPELDRLAKGDAEFVERVTQMHAVAQPDLSHGAFPDLSKVRFYEITTFRVRPGHGGDFTAATKAYKAAASRSNPDAKWRTYEVVAGAPGGTYLVFSSVGAFAEFDKMMAGSEATWKGVTADEMAALQKYMREGALSTVTQRFRVDPGMSYLDAATRAKDPAFWGPKK